LWPSRGGAGDLGAEGRRDEGAGRGGGEGEEEEGASIDAGEVGLCLGGRLEVGLEGLEHVFGTIHRWLRKSGSEGVRGWGSWRCALDAPRGASTPRSVRIAEPCHHQPCPRSTLKSAKSFGGNGTSSVQVMLIGRSPVTSSALAIRTGPQAR